MITYEEALKKARMLKNGITKCYETPKAYLFKNEDDEYSFGGEGICVILKENGRAIGLTAYYNGGYVDYDESECREYDVKCNTGITLERALEIVRASRKKANNCTEYEDDEYIGSADHTDGAIQKETGEK